jgi:hypothetical protein
VTSYLKFSALMRKLRNAQMEGLEDEIADCNRRTKVRLEEEREEAARSCGPGFKELVDRDLQGQGDTGL